MREIIQLCGAARNDTEQTENIKEIYVVKTKTRAATSQQYDGAVILIIRISKYIPAVVERDPASTLLY